MENKVACARLEAHVFRSGRKYLETAGFLELFPPRIVRASGACENVNTLFEVSSNRDFLWFGPPGQKHKSYLAQTGQLYLEAYVPYAQKIFCIGPSFRAEPGNDNRHLTEFMMTEIEFAGTFDDLLKHIEGYIYTIAQDISKLDAQSLKKLGIESEAERLSHVKPVFPRVTYDEAIAELGLEWGDDINSAKEQELVKSHGGQPLLITRYPDPLYDHGKEIEVEKFFNMIPDPENPGRVLSADLILPIAGEAVGSAARLHDADTLVKRLEHSKMFKRLLELGGSLGDFSWYIERIKEKTVPHAGCGFGMSRILRWVANTDDIKKSVTFPSNQEHII